MLEKTSMSKTFFNKSYSFLLTVHNDCFCFFSKQSNESKSNFFFKIAFVLKNSDDICTKLSVFY